MSVRIRVPSMWWIAMCWTATFPNLIPKALLLLRSGRTMRSPTSMSRAELKAAIARTSALMRTQQRTANPPKEYPKKTRGKSSKGAAAKKEDEDIIELD